MISFVPEYSITITHYCPYLGRALSFEDLFFLESQTLSLGQLLTSAFSQRRQNKDMDVSL